MLNKTTSILAALVCTTLLASGCGNSNSAKPMPGSINGAVGAVGASSGTITLVAGGGGQINFNGINVFANGGYVGTTNGFTSTPTQDFYLPGAMNTLGLGTSNCPGCSMALSATSTTDSSTRITMMTNSVSSVTTANIGGAIYLSSSFVLANFPIGANGQPTLSVQGLAVDLAIASGSTVSGAVYICTQKDPGTGACHGPIVNF
ncbi:MAG: hypothetical protein HY074_01270 [Deltaproteobacteria bacterium]|nr:hypothetical protein [Deltaproteobacteria bacterium]